MCRNVQDGVVSCTELTRTCVIMKTTDIDRDIYMCGHKHLIFGPGHPIVFVRWSEASKKGLEHLTWSLASVFCVQAVHSCDVTRTKPNRYLHLQVLNQSGYSHQAGTQSLLIQLCHLLMFGNGPEAFPAR